MTLGVTSPWFMPARTSLKVLDASFVEEEAYLDGESVSMHREMGQTTGIHMASVGINCPLEESKVVVGMLDTLPKPVLLGKDIVKNYGGGAFVCETRSQKN